MWHPAETPMPTAKKGANCAQILRKGVLIVVSLPARRALSLRDLPITIPFIGFVSVREMMQIENGMGVQSGRKHCLPIIAQRGTSDEHRLARPARRSSLQKHLHISIVASVMTRLKSQSVFFQKKQHRQKQRHPAASAATTTNSKTYEQPV